MELSPTKNFCCASRIRVGRAIIEALPRLMLSFARRVTSLGAPLAAGRRRSSLVATKRLRAFRVRVKRFRCLRRVGINTARLIRTGGSAAMTYGQHVCGVSNALLLQQRRTVAACTVLSRGGGDLDVTLMLADGSGTGRADPAFDAHIAPIGHWALAIWESWAPRPLLQRLVIRAKLRLSLAKSTWANVHGPAAAFVASALRLKWVIHDACRVTMDDGVNLNFAVDSPSFVKRAVCQSVRRWRWRAIGIRTDGADPDGCGDGSFMLPIFRLLDPSKQCSNVEWGPAQRAGLRSALAGRQWTQDRLHADPLRSVNCAVPPPSGLRSVGVVSADTPLRVAPWLTGIGSARSPRHGACELHRLSCAAGARPPSWLAGWTPPCGHVVCGHYRRSWCRNHRRRPRSRGSCGRPTAVSTASCTLMAQ